MTDLKLQIDKIADRIVNDTIPLMNEQTSANLKYRNDLLKETILFANSLLEKRINQVCLQVSTVVLFAALLCVLCRRFTQNCQI